MVLRGFVMMLSSLGVVLCDLDLLVAIAFSFSFRPSVRQAVTME